jgi:hypothetical protein
MTNSDPFTQTKGILSDVNDVKQIGYGIVTDVQPNNNLTVTLQFLGDDSSENNSTRCPVVQPSSDSVVLPNEGDLAIYAATSNGAPVVLGTVSDEEADIPDYTTDETKIDGLDTGIDVENYGTVVVDGTTNINFGRSITPTDDGDGTVTVDVEKGDPVIATGTHTVDSSDGVSDTQTTVLLITKEANYLHGGYVPDPSNIIDTERAYTREGGFGEIITRMAYSTFYGSWIIETVAAGDATTGPVDIEWTVYDLDRFLSI